ncbi:MAG: hypothetical protein IJ774_03665 [Selenomonadaceae bacterium]|nr:hypothetical protein [Selenomonadaceae bacterium]
MYKLDELVKAARKIFDASPVLVEAALKLDGRQTFTLDEAKEIVAQFAKREVKS